MTDGQIDSLKKKAHYYFENKIKVHIKKKNDWFNNGFILEIEGDLLVLDDRVLSAMPIYFIEILEIEKAKEEEK